MQKKLTRFELLMTSIGIVVGAGVVTATGLAIGQTGRSAWISYLLAVIVGLLLAVPDMFNCSIMIIDGGYYTTTRLYCGTTVAATSTLAGILNFFGNGMMSLAAGAYISSLLPSLNGRIIAGIVLTVLFLINLWGVKAVGRFQAIASPVMMTGLGIFIVAGLFQMKYNPFSFSDPGFFKNGLDGVLSACALLCFSTQGVMAAFFFSKHSENPKKDVPWCMVITALFILVLYTLIAMVAGNVLPVDEVAGKPLTAVAFTILPHWLAILFVVFGPIMAIVTTINGGWTAFYKSFSACAKEGILPKFIAKENKNGIPYIILLTQYAFAMFPIVSGLSIQAVMNALVLVTALMNLFVRVGLFRMPTMFKEEWKKSRLHVPNIVYYLFCTIAVLLDLFLAWQSIINLQSSLVILNFAVLIVAFIYCYVRIKAGKVSPRSLSYSLKDHWEEDTSLKQ